MSFNNETVKQVIAENLTKSPSEKLHDGLQHIPEKRILDCLQIVHHQYLPKVKASRGENHADTIFFTEIRDSLIWALNILDRYHNLSLNYSNIKMLSEFQANRIRLLEKEQAKYEALEDIEVNGTLESYRNVVIHKAKMFLDQDNKH